MITLARSLQVWGSSEFEKVLVDEIQNLRHDLLPLQAGLSQSNYVADSPIKVVLLNIAETEDSIRVKTAIFYAGVNAGSCCADDPTPVDEQPEYCELQIDLNKQNAQADVTLLEN